MVTARYVLVLALMAGVLLSGCGESFSGGSRGPAWHSGYNAGKSARSDHAFRHGATKYDVTAFCVQTAFNDIRTMKTGVLKWTEGFEQGCMRS